MRDVKEVRMGLNVRMPKEPIAFMRVQMAGTHASDLSDDGLRVRSSREAGRVGPWILARLCSNVSKYYTIDDVYDLREVTLGRVVPPGL